MKDISPLPWISSGTHIQALYTPNDGGKPFYKTVARLDQPLVTGEECEANSEMIARAVNAYGDLIETLKIIQDGCEAKEDGEGEEFDLEAQEAWIETIARMAKEAIKKAQNQVDTQTESP